MIKLKTKLRTDKEREAFYLGILFGINVMVLGISINLLMIL